MYNYTISSRYRSGYDDDNAYNEVLDCGDFRSTVDFTVSDKNNNINNVNGIIVQYIQKSTVVDIYDENGGGTHVTLPNNEMDITRYTNNNVQYMNYNYIEYFDINENESVHGDQFGNGPICKYDGDEPMVDDELDMSVGKIIQNGFAIFIPDKIVKENNIIKGIRWNRSEDTPANGLPMIEYDAKV
jgi:hypothetical protein